MEIMKTWLGRSGQCPISLESTHGVKPVTIPTTLPHTDRFLHALIPFARRWRDIHFRIPLFLLQTLSSLAEADVPMLKKVSFYQSAYNGTDSPEWELLRMLRGSQVTSFTISGTDLALGELPLHWNRLTVLSITASPWSVWLLDSGIILQAISRCPELRRCRLILSSALDNGMWSPKPIVELPFLHTLEIHCVGGVASTFTCLLKRLALPQLRNFNLHGNTGDVQDEENIPSLTSFFALSVHLKSVQVDAPIFLKSSFLEFLRSLPPKYDSATPN